MFGYISSWFRTAPVSEEIVGTLKSTIASRKVVVYSKTYCPYCTKTKTLLKDLNQDALVIELDRRQDGSVLQNGLAELTGQRTVPNVFIDGKHIGGNSDLQELYSDGSLKSLLA